MGRPVGLIEELEQGVIVGTAHVSAKSVQDVENTIRARQPQRVLIELDPRRFEAIQDPDRWRNTDIVQVLREKKQHLFLLQLYLANMQARVGRETGVRPGSEMLRAVEVAEEIGAEVVLIDRDVTITLKRGFGAMGFWQRLKLFWNVWADILTPSKEEPMDVDAMLQTDAITAMTDEFARFAPVVKTALIDERDAYMASHIEAESAKGSLVAVVGAGHLPGIRRHLAQGTKEIDREALDQLPPKRFTVGKFLAYAVPLAILGAFGYAWQTGGFDELLANLKIWIFWNGLLAAVGAMLALGHPLSWIVAFIAAPITSINPLLAAGWFAGLTEAKVRTPKVADFEAISHIETLRGFWTNPVVRVLLVTALANVGSSIATYLAGYQIVQNLFGS
ncbi:MAG: TraB/GumN family protein [Thermoplasmatota archaeon]